MSVSLVAMCYNRVKHLTINFNALFNRLEYLNLINIHNTRISVYQTILYSKLFPVKPNTSSFFDT